MLDLWRKFRLETRLNQATLFLGLILLKKTFLFLISGILLFQCVYLWAGCTLRTSEKMQIPLLPVLLDVPLRAVAVYERVVIVRE